MSKHPDLMRYALDELNVPHCSTVDYTYKLFVAMDANSEKQVNGRFRLDIIIGKSLAIFQLFTTKDKNGTAPTSGIVEKQSF